MPLLRLRLLLLVLFVAVSSAARLDAPTGATPSACGQACHTNADCAGTCNTCIAGYCNQTVFVYTCAGNSAGASSGWFTTGLLRPAVNKTVGNSTCATVRSSRQRFPSTVSFFLFSPTPSHHTGRLHLSPERLVHAWRVCGTALLCKLSRSSICRIECNWIYYSGVPSGGLFDVVASICAVLASCYDQ